MVEVHAGYYPLQEIINMSGLPLHATVEANYSWNDLKMWIADPTISVIAYVPRHAVLINATCETKDGKYRHALLGRISGGQSPCSFVPFTKKDVLPDEDCWVKGGNVISSKSCIPLHITDKDRYYNGKSAYKAVVVRKKSTNEYEPHEMFKDFNPPEWLQSKELICDTCVLHKGLGDSINHPKERLKWLLS